MEETGELHYMTEGGAGTLAYRDRAIEALKVAKELEAGRTTIPVWVDFQTTKFMDIEKIKRHKLEIIRVKIDKKGLVWIEKSNAIKQGFITE